MWPYVVVLGCFVGLLLVAIGGATLRKMDKGGYGD